MSPVATDKDVDLILDDSSELLGRKSLRTIAVASELWQRRINI